MQIDITMGTIRRAIEIENFGYGFYNTMRDFVNDRSAQSIISHLAEMELEHMKWLEEEYKRTLQNSDVLNESGAQPISIIAKGEIFLDHRRLPEIFSDFDAVKAIKFAIDIEKRSVEFYKKNQKIIDDYETRNLFGRLADFEKDHIALLTDNLKSLERTGDWKYK